MSVAPLHRIVALRMVTRDPDRLARFYGEALGAMPEGGPTSIGPDECQLLGVAGGSRCALRIGGFAVELDRFDDPGRPYPADADAADLRFQHFAAIVRDIGAVFERARACGATLVSREGPVTLPASSGGATAVKLCDPDGHPFELLQFPQGADNHWRETTANAAGVLGIDHTAISVADAARSRCFYGAAGLTAGGATLNRGTAQDALDGLALRAVDVVPMMPSVAAPHLELLGYRGVAGRRVAKLDIADIAATRTVWASDREMLLLDPDGHRHQSGMVDAGPSSAHRA